VLRANEKNVLHSDDTTQCVQTVLKRLLVNTQTVSDITM